MGQKSQRSFDEASSWAPTDLPDGFKWRFVCETSYTPNYVLVAAEIYVREEGGAERVVYREHEHSRLNADAVVATMLRVMARVPQDHWKERGRDLLAYSKWTHAPAPARILEG